MEFTSGKPSIDGSTGEATSDSGFQSPEEMIAFARDYLSSDFPNPERLGCPAPGTLGALVRSGALPDDELRAHLFGCSECFEEHRDALAAQRDTALTPTTSWWSRLLAALTLKPVPVITSAFSVLLLSVIGAYVWREYRKDPVPKPVPGVAKSDSAPINRPSDDSADDSAEGGLASATPEISPAPVTPTEQAPSGQTRGRTNQRTAPAPRPRPTEQRPRELIAMSTVKVDLEEYPVLRGGEEAGGDSAKVIRLPRSRTRLTLRLPEGSVKGLYTVGIVDPSGTPLVTAKASSADGRTITMTLDIQGLTPNKYRLRVAREGEAPDHYPVVVGDEKTSPEVRRP